MIEIKYKIGIDEVGRGPVAGPVAVCVSLIKVSDEEKIKGLLTEVRDSKKIAEKKRIRIFNKIKDVRNERLIISAISMVSAPDIDKIGISKSIQKALDTALEKVSAKFKLDELKVLLDGGLKCSSKFKNQQTIIKGDEKEFIISLSSIIAKVLRDKKMIKYAEQYPEYFLEKNKGYGTKQHMEAIQKYGLTKIHRKSFLKRFLK